MIFYSLIVFCYWNLPNRMTGPILAGAFQMWWPQQLWFFDEFSKSQNEIVFPGESFDEFVFAFGCF